MMTRSGLFRRLPPCYWQFFSNQFVTLEFTFVLNAEATMPTSPWLSSPSALRLPWKDNGGPTGPATGLLGSVGVACLFTRPSTCSTAPG